MKIFIVHKDIYNAGNPYIYTLKDEIERVHNDVIFKWGEEIFWSEELLEFDIVHFHWPAAFLDCDTKHHSIDDFKNQLLKAKNNGAKIVSTCHDLCPHYSQGARFAEAITFVYQQSDAIFHLGEYSQKLFEAQFTQSKHYILPHHIYDQVYTSFYDKEYAKKKLGLNMNKKYVLCMGAFRAQEERDMVLSLVKVLKCKNVEFIAPAFDNARNSLKKKFPFVTRGLLKYIYYRYFLKIHLTGKTWVPIKDEEIPLYYAACDVALVQRLKILNSGNAVMPLLFGCPVCGPNMGNIGPFLKEYAGYVFDIDRIDQLPDLLIKIINSNNSKAAKKIQNNAKKFLSTEKIAAVQYDYYLRINSL